MANPLSCAVVTGAASGIGRGIAQALAARGIPLVIADIDTDKLHAVAAGLARTAPAVRVVAIPTDVADAAQVGRLCTQAFDAFGRVDWLYNCAGVLTSGASWEIGEDMWRRVIDINLWSVIHTARAFVPRMIEQGGAHIVNIASLAGLLVGPWLAPYTVSKHGMVAISESMRMEFAERGLPIDVSIVCPGPVRTAIFSALDPHAAETHVAQTNQYLRALGDDGMTPEELARIVLAGVDAKKPWIFPHGEVLKNALRQRSEALLSVE